MAKNSAKKKSQPKKQRWADRPRVNRPFVGIPSFLRAPIVTDLDQLDHDIAYIGVPTDEGSPFLPGSRFGPRAIREHSLRLVVGNGYYNLDTGRHYLLPEMRDKMIADTGDCDILPTNVEKTFRNITDHVRKVIDMGAFPVAIGGDHAITYPVVRGFKEPLHIIHFDAHLDYAPFIHDLRFTNGHPFRNIRPMKHVQSLTQVGIRSLRTTTTQLNDTKSDGNRVIGMEEFYKIGPKGVAKAVPKGAACYVSIDIDVFDISLCPGCVSAEPNGMMYKELRDTLRAIAEHTTVIGFDFVEVNPQLDVGTGVTSYLGMHTVVEFLGNICDQPYWVKRREANAAARAERKAAMGAGTGGKR